MSKSKVSKTTEAMYEMANGFLDFVNASRSPYHAVYNAAKELKAAGFQRLSETDSWANNVNPGDKFFVTRNQGSIVAVAVGSKYESGNGALIYGAHTDSPCLKVKPVSTVKKQGYLEVGVECYGGGLWHTWFDRDLCLAGRVVVKGEKGFAAKLVNIDKPIMRIPTLAIHLTKERESFKFNNETQLLPVLCTAVKDALNQPESGSSSESSSESSSSNSSSEYDHYPSLLSLLATELDCAVDDIADFDLCLADHQPANLGGLHNEFIFSPRLDNLMMSYTGLRAFVDAEGLEEETGIRVLALFDHEEVGSTSSHGANSNLLPQVLDRVIKVLAPSSSSSDDVEETTYNRSFFISADMAHAVHPNYSEVHESNHRPVLHEGTVLKINSNQRYATTALSKFLVKEIAARNDIPLQEFVVRNDSRCGSTIGPMVAAKTGIRTVDLGNPQLSMHSIREMCGVDDTKHGYDLFKAFFEQFFAIDAELSVDDFVDA